MLKRIDMKERKILFNPVILFEDENLVIIDKPSGISVSPERGAGDGINLMKIIHEKLSPEYFNIHRLDKETSGALLCGKNKSAVAALTRLFEAREVKKNYYALVCPAPREQSGLISIPIRPGSLQAAGTNPRLGGKNAETEYEVLERFKGGYALVKAMPGTGRTHQIRIHLSHIGSPIIGDILYGNGRLLYLSEIKKKYKEKKWEEERPIIGRLALHAKELIFIHPFTNLQLQISSPFPKDFELALKQLRRYAL
jgi:23S rRNA pseudouridine1911/1915/1917 synthase